MPASILVGGTALATLVTTLGTTTGLLVLSRVAYDVGFSAGSIGAIAVAVTVGTLAFACIGYAVAGMIGNPDAAQPVVQATMMPLYFISGIWIPTDQLPHGLRTIAAIFPIEHLAAATHLASVRGSFSSALAPTDLLRAGRLGLRRGDLRRTALQLAAGRGDRLDLHNTKEKRCSPCSESRPGPRPSSAWR